MIILWQLNKIDYLKLSLYELIILLNIMKKLLEWVIAYRMLKLTKTHNFLSDI